MWTVAVVPVLVLTMPLFLQVVESRWVDPAPRSRPVTVAPADRVGPAEAIPAHRAAPARPQGTPAGRRPFPVRVSAA